MLRILLPVCLALAACAQAPKGDAPAPLEIPAHELRNYWRSVDTGFPVSSVRLPGPCEPREVRVRYTITSAGHATDIELLPPRPFNVFQERHLENEIRRQNFRPAPDNEEARQPVTVVERYRIDCPPG